MFKANHVSRSGIIKLAAPPQKVFHLFEPIDEKLWAEGWTPEILYPSVEKTIAGMVFLTANHRGEPKTIWYMTKYDTTGFEVEYLRISPESRLGIVAVKCEAGDEANTLAKVSYTFTALSEQGNQWLENFTVEHYRAMMLDWEKAINHYLLSGTTLHHH
jgi:hypothetical protein